ncbi:integration host factor subunit alpha [Deferribacter autotrophicus]|uniref:Integration host factor subunit alpha n=1 Tax=Deferribacter autotrophicus TaxID=500465 RepID=A0A5A8F1K2_9BACT|nr:integration host factor subunit alpha [Deferribacter autotrophicus]KAA0257307.1 integration host factor subunit alpha [Deferribacter autotrophicus]
MTKADIVEKIYEKLGITKKDIANVVDMVFTTMREEILSGNSVKVSGFGNFEVKVRGRRVGRNPKTGDEVVIPPRYVVSFKPSHLFKEEVNA